MKAEIRNILKLQEIDIQVAKNKYELENIEEKKEYDSLSGKLAELEKKDVALSKLLKAEQLTQDKNNGELDLLSQKIEKEEKKLFSGSVTNPKELSAIEQEVAHLKEKRDNLETAMLEHMEKLSALEAEVNQLEENVDEFSAQVDEKKEAWLEKVQSYEARIDELMAKREKQLEEIDKDILDEYNEIRASKGVVAAAEIIDGICQACRVELPEEELDEIINSEDYDYCPSCGRIVILKK